MMFADIDKGFQIAFEQGWIAYRKGNVPIGAAIMAPDGSMAATGQNQIFAAGDGKVSLHGIAHAEINAILKLSAITDPCLHENIRSYTLYSTMEPCPACFGAIVMGNIRHLKFAARDRFAGATAMNDSIAYIRNKKINVEGPFEVMEAVHIAMQTCYELERQTHAEVLLDSWSQACMEGVEIGVRLHETGALHEMRNSGIAHVYDAIAGMLRAL